MPGVKRLSLSKVFWKDEINNKMFKPSPLLSILIFAGLSVGAWGQESAFVGLEKYLNQQMAGPEAIRVIKHHLSESGTMDPVTELVRWARAGFPELHDENGVWQTESLSLKLAVVHSIHYYFKTSPPEDKSERYLEIAKELRSDDYISYHLAVTAHLAVDAAALEQEVLELFRYKDPKERARGVLLGSTIAEKARPMFERYVQMLKDDDDARVRVNILFSISSWRRKEVAYVGLRSLISDPDDNVRDWGGRCLRVAAESNLLTSEDLPSILAPMLETENLSVKVSLGRAAARISTDRSLGIEEDKINGDLLAGFIGRAKSRESKDGAPLDAEALADVWLSWWRPLIPVYAKPYKPAH
jgi:hypothetical protein